MIGPVAPYAASLVGGTVMGMIVGDVLGSVPTAAAVPATSSSAAPVATADGTPVAGNMNARQIVFLSAGYVIGAIVLLLFGSRALRDARIS